jgi:hypothetical protein
MSKLWALPVLSLAVTFFPVLASSSALATTLFRADMDIAQEVCSKPGPCPTTNPPPPPFATAVFTAVLNDAEDELSYQFEIKGLDLASVLNPPPTPDGDDVYKVHIHRGVFGATGPVAFAPIDLTMAMPPDNPYGSDDPNLSIQPFTDGTLGGIVSGVWKQSYGLVGAPPKTTLQEQLENLKSGKLYANIHSFRFLANGELRGQIHKVPEPSTIIGLAFAGGIGACLRKRKIKR